jgi:hypothetical protein
VTSGPPLPAVLRVVAPAAAGTSLLVVALTAALRQHGFRVGSVEARSGLAGVTATVLTTGSGARITLPGTIDLATLPARASAFDPARPAAVALAPGGVPPSRSSSARAQPSTPPTDLLAIVTPEHLSAAHAAVSPTTSASPSSRSVPRGRATRGRTPASPAPPKHPSRARASSSARPPRPPEVVRLAPLARADSRPGVADQLPDGCARPLETRSGGRGARG